MIPFLVQNSESIACCWNLFTFDLPLRFEALAWAAAANPTEQASLPTSVIPTAESTAPLENSDGMLESVEKNQVSTLFAGVVAVSAENSPGIADLIAKHGTLALFNLLGDPPKGGIQLQEPRSAVIPILCGYKKWI